MECKETKVTCRVSQSVGDSEMDDQEDTAEAEAVEMVGGAKRKRRGAKRKRRGTKRQHVPDELRQSESENGNESDEDGNGYDPKVHAGREERGIERDVLMGRTGSSASDEQHPSNMDMEQAACEALGGAHGENPTDTPSANPTEVALASDGDDVATSVQERTSVREVRRESSAETESLVENILDAIRQDLKPLDEITADNEDPKVWRAVVKKALEAAWKTSYKWVWDESGEEITSFEEFKSRGLLPRGIVITANRAHWLNAKGVPAAKHALVGKSLTNLSSITRNQKPFEGICIPFTARTNHEQVNCVLWNRNGLEMRRSWAMKQEPREITKVTVCKHCGQLCTKLCGGCKPVQEESE